MKQCAGAAKDVGKDNLDTGLMIASPQELNEAEGVADTSTTKFFSEEIETTRETDTKDQRVAGSRLNYGLYLFNKPCYWHGCFTALHPVRSAADDAIIFPCPNVIAHNMRQKLFHVVPQQTQSFDRAVENQHFTQNSTCPFVPHGPVIVRANSSSE